MNKLAAKKASDGEGEVIKGEKLKLLLAKLGGGWISIEGHHLEKDWTFKDFREALAFTNKVGELAEAAGHHPDIYLAWGRVKIKIWTHSKNGLTESDFVLAAKIDQIK